jgi:hypothetical protein
MPRKVFADLNILNAQDLNDNFMDQAVMTFADAGTRDSQIPLAQRKPGMLAFTADTQMWWQWIVVAAVGYWAPQVGTPVCSMYANATQTLSVSGTYYPIALAGVTRNMTLNGSACWVSNRFNPKVPGWYVLNGGVYFGPNATNYRIAAIYKNGVGVPSSGNQTPVNTASWGTSLSTRTVFVQFNGTTDYAELMAMQASGGSMDTSSSGNISSTFNAVYGGQ